MTKLISTKEALKKMKDIQSWWEVPSIAYFCSLFRTAFNLLDFDIEELEEALLTDGSEESASSLLTELIVRLLNGCLGTNNYDISASNYQMYLRRLFRQKCQETGRYNPFNTDIDFQFLPLRKKVEILYALCDFRLDAEDVFDLFKNLEAESLRVEPLGWDENDSTYWYFYGTRLYREDIAKKTKGKRRKRTQRVREIRKRGWFYGDDWLNEDVTDRIWQVVCFTEEDWTHLTEKFSQATTKVERELYRSLSQNFLPEIPRLFQEKERLQRKRLLESAPRRTSSRVLQKIKQKEEEKNSVNEASQSERSETPERARDTRARRRDLLREQSSSSSSDSDSSDGEAMPQRTKRAKKATNKGEPPPRPVKVGRKTNNSLASATGQILIPDTDEPPANSTRKKVKPSQIFSQTEEDVQTDMYKVLEQLINHEDAWPFMDPVEEQYAPNYYAVIRRPMDLKTMEERLDNGHYPNFTLFQADFKLIVNNCRLYNGQDNEYTAMVDNLQAAFDRLTDKYIHRTSSSDEEIAIEYQVQQPRKHKLRPSDVAYRHKRKKRKSQSDDKEDKSAQASTPPDDEAELEPAPIPESTPGPARVPDPEPEAHSSGSSSSRRDEQPDSDDEPTPERKEEEPAKEQEDEDAAEPKKKSHKSRQGKGKKKRHRHGKHSKSKRKGESKRHGKKHGKNKDKDGKKSKRKKSKHQEPEPPPELKRSPSHESLESSSRSRSASPLPSIHTLSPSPSEADKNETQDQLSDPEFQKDKYDKIKERRRHAAKDAWESLFDRNKTNDKLRPCLTVPEKDKHSKLKETIEKLKAKNKRCKDPKYDSLFRPGQSSDRRTEKKKGKATKPPLPESDTDTDDEVLEMVKAKTKKSNKKSAAKNESASEALEQAVKDISKWLDDAPRGSAMSSPCDSPAQTISTEDHDNSRQDDELSQGEKSMPVKKDILRKRPSSREPKTLKRREIQRTIDRLQPGKSKGNLLTNMANKNTDKQEEAAPQVNKTRDGQKTEESSPKLSLGSVLPAVDFGIGTEHNFNDDNEMPSTSKAKIPEKTKLVKTAPTCTITSADLIPTTSKKNAEVETEPTTPKPSQEKATPNLSAWFKAFGAPKNTTATTKKKVEEPETEEKAKNTTKNDAKKSPKNNINQKLDTINDPATPNPEGGDSPLTNVTATRQRRTSTGSSVSERSSFSQDLDSPRHQMSHTSPLLRSPASPRTDDFQKITYPIINGTVRAGFYQDTTSMKSSPEKSCSPREAPQSPYSPYSQHVYASNNMAGSATPNYFVDHNKSPLSYGQSTPSYYDSAKITKPPRAHDDFSTLAQDYQNQYNASYSPVPSPYPAQTSYSQPQHSPQPIQTPTPVNAQVAEPKSTLFPVKKRMYNEPEINSLKKPDTIVTPVTNKNEYVKISQLPLPIGTPSVDDIALALSEKNEIAKNNRERNSTDYAPEQRETHINIAYNHDNHVGEKETNNVNKSINMTKKDNIDMVNMGYLNPEVDKRPNYDPDVQFVSREVLKPAVPQHKAYEMDGMAINLGMNNHNLQKLQNKTMMASNMTPAHSHERHTEMNVNQNIAHAHHNQYDMPSTSVNNFTMNDIETANKKLYASSTSTTTSTAIDYGNWKMSSQARKQDMMPSDYSTSYATEDKIKNDSTNVAINYNKNVQQQYNNYNNVPRLSAQRVELQQNLPAELRIPNPRGLLKNDHTNATSAHNQNEIDTLKNADAHSKTQKAEKLVQNHPMVNTIPYKTAYNAHSSLPIDTLRNLPSIPQMLERYTNDERYLSSFASGSSSLYHDKTYQMAQMFNKTLPSEVHPVSSTSVNIYSQPTTSISKDNNIYKSTPSASASQDKSKLKRKRSEVKPQAQAQAYHPATCSSDVLTSVKPTMMPSAFNFAASPNMALGGMYDNGAFSIDDFRNSTNQLMAANYMAAAVAHQRNTEATEKLAKPAHQNSNSTFPFIGHSQVRAGYPFIGTDTSSPLYQQYLQRYQEELQRQTMGLYPTTYPSALGVRQPYDAINRPSWL